MFFSSQKINAPKAFYGSALFFPNLWRESSLSRCAFKGPGDVATPIKKSRALDTTNSSKKWGSLEAGFFGALFGAPFG